MDGGKRSDPGHGGEKTTLAYDIEQAADKVGCTAGQLYRFLRRVERGLGYRGPMGSGDRHQRAFTDDQVRNIRLAYHQVNKAR
jgi:hypothetical protein